MSSLFSEHHHEIGGADIDTRLAEQGGDLSAMMGLVIEEVLHERTEIVGECLSDGIRVVQKLVVVIVLGFRAELDDRCVHVPPCHGEIR